MPVIRGTPRIMNIVTKTSKGFKLTRRRIEAVAGLRLPQKARLTGVMTMAAAVDTAVMLTDTAALPLAR